MSNKNNEILRYLAGIMNEKEKHLFEERLKSSGTLRADLEESQSRLGKARELANIGSDDSYFAALPVRARNRLKMEVSGGESILIKNPIKGRLASGLAVAAAVLILLIPALIFTLRSSGTADLPAEIASLKESEGIEIIESLDAGQLASAEGQAIVTPGELSDEAASGITDELLQINSHEAVPNIEAIRTAELLQQNENVSDMVNDLSDTEAENVYQALAEKKIL